MQEIVGLRNKILGEWLGKNIGGTLGGPYEGQLGQLFLHYYDPVPTEPMPNDDFELQLVWLDMLNKKGVFITPRDFVYHWRNHALYYISEYFVGQQNMAHGILPPMSGAFDNWFINGMGATIRSEIWAGIAPGLPDIAAAYAYMDACADHAMEGIHGEMFFAALESAAFVESDPWKLVEIGLSYVPRECAVRDVVEFVKAEAAKNTSWHMIRHLICTHYAHPTDFTYVPTNLGFVVMALLSGRDFSEAICNAVNCGYDADCTGATIGSILGISLGATKIPPEWLEPIGTAVKVSDYVPGIEYAADVNGVTDQICAHARTVLSDPRAVREHLFRWTGLQFLRTHTSGSISLPPSTRVKLAVENGIAVDVDYHDHPAIGIGDEKSITLAFHNLSAEDMDAEASIELPAGWSSAQSEFRLRMGPHSCVELPLLVRTDQDAVVEPVNMIRLNITDGASLKTPIEFSLVGKNCWVVTRPIMATDSKHIELIEEDGFLDPLSDDVDRVQLVSNALRDLLPHSGEVVFAQTDLYVAQDTNVRLIANSTGPISVYLNGEKIIEKQHRSAGILPSWHLQNISIHLLPRDLGFGDQTLRAGWNSVMVRLDGVDYEQDVNFHLVGIAARNLEDAKWADFGLPSGVSNTSWRDAFRPCHRETDGCRQSDEDKLGQRTMDRSDSLGHVVG